MLADFVKITRALYPPGWPIRLVDVLMVYSDWKTHRDLFKELSVAAADAEQAAEVAALAAPLPAPT